MTAPTSRELAKGLGHGKTGRYQVSPPEERTWVDPEGKAVVFDSKHEMDHYLVFVGLERCGAVTELQRQVEYVLHSVTPNGHKVKVGSYVADWTCRDREGRLCVYDPKGHRTEKYKMKKKMVEAEYGIRVLEL